MANIKVFYLTLSDRRMNEKYINIKGARTHNLSIEKLSIPRDKLVVLTGISGSGKSSLAFDTIFAEGQRRYIESLSAYARQFLKQMPKPDVDEISGLSPAISIDQKTRSGNPRSTVATITEIYDHLRVLFSRIGKPHCLVCGKLIKKMSHQEIIDLILGQIEKAINDSKIESMSIQIYAPLVRGRKGEYYQLLYDLLDKGYREVLINGRRHKLRERIFLSRQKRHDIDVLVDEIDINELLSIGSGQATVKGSVAKLIQEGARERLAEGVERSLNESDDLVRLVVGESGRSEKVLDQAYSQHLISAKFSCPEDGFSYPEIEPRLFSFNSPYGACPSCHGLGTEHLFGEKLCSACQGTRLRPEALAVRIGGSEDQPGKNIVEITELSIRDAYDFFGSLNLTQAEQTIAEMLLKEITDRLGFLLSVGLDYITLNRKAGTLSGGEAQRIRLASQLGSRLVGTLYVLDEPTIGLHPRDNDRLIKTLQELKNLGNTIIVVEHDPETIYSSDWLVDIGPGAGRHGGKVVVSEKTEKLLTEKENNFGSLTVDYLREERVVPVPEKRRTAKKGSLKIRGGRVFNLKNINLDLPLGKLVTVTGLSGSGKSSLVYEIIYKNLQARFDRRYRSNEVFNCKSFSGVEYLSRAILINQSPIGRTPRSNPVTYVGAWGYIRELLASTELARARGWKPGRFSFNVKGGRCEACQGKGSVAVEMHFLPTIYVTCDVCGGRRFRQDTLEVRYNKKNVDDILQLTVEEALEFFADIPAVHDRLATLAEVGLGYLCLGQSATTLSGGEAQRVKISSELYRPLTRKTIYILDEPTVGLHYEDVNNLVAVLQKLVERGNTVVVIEHNLDVIKNSDHIVDLGPEGGDKGGKIVAVGTPENISQDHRSITGKYLKKVLPKRK